MIASSSSLLQNTRTSISPSQTKPVLTQLIRNFRSKSALETLAKASEDQTPNLILYNYPSFSGAFAALFSRLYHSHLHLPHLILPFSSVEPFKINDFKFPGLQTCYILDFTGPKEFAVKLAQSVGRVVVFDHRKTALSKVPPVENCPENLIFNVDTEKSSSMAVYDYFSGKLVEKNLISGEKVSLVKCEDKDRMEMVLKYIEDIDLRKWSLPDIKAFNVGLSELRSQLNCITNPYIFDQLLEASLRDMVTRGNTNFSSRQDAANKLLDRAFKVRLGRGLYGECLGVRADGYSHLTNETGRELSLRSAEAGLRPVGAVIYMQGGNLKMCLRSVDSGVDTSEVAKAYGGGGTPCSSSFIIRMDEYNQWTSVNSTYSC